VKIFAVLDETPFYHPDFFADLLRKTKDEIVGVAIVIEIPKSNNVNSYLIRNWRFLKFSEMAILAWRKYTMLFKNFFLVKRKDGKFYSVKAVCQTFGIPYFEVYKCINKKEYLDKIRSYEPDVLFSSNSLIFKKELLTIPQITCLNRHSALLPSYGGLWPVLRSFSCGEKEFGVSVHIMEVEIDSGSVLSQKSFHVDESVTIAQIYQRCFALSAEVVLDALDKVRAGDFSNCSDRPTSYYSFPKAEDWQKFRQLGGRFV